MSTKILAIDDSSQILSILEITILQAGYDPILAQSGKEGLLLFESESPDLVLLDINMPEMTGWEVCKRIRETSNVPIIFLTAAHVTVADRVRGLDMGANDYIVKPFNQNEFLARVRANLRISPLLRNQHEYDDGYLYVNLLDREVKCNGEPVDLTEKEFGLLRTLLQSVDQTVTNETLFKKVWGYPDSFDPNYVRIYASSLRRKIEPNAKIPVYIMTERGIGYRFVTHQDKAKKGFSHLNQIAR